MLKHEWGSYPFRNPEPKPKPPPTAQDVLKHKWVCGAAPETNLDTTNLKKYNASRKLKKAADKIIMLKRMGMLNIAAQAKTAEVGQ